MKSAVIKGASRYLVFEDGSMQNVETGRVFYGHDNGNGYIRTTLRWDCGSRKRAYIHRLVAIAFIDQPDGTKEVDHKNGIRHDNRIENLEWVTSSINTQRGYDRFNYRARPSTERPETIPYYSGVRTKRCGSGKPLLLEGDDIVRSPGKPEGSE